MTIEFTRESSPLATLPRVPRPPRRPWLRLLSEVLALAGSGAELLRHGERPWASATFAGSRHTILLAFEGPEATTAGEAFVTVLPDHEFSISGQFVADATISAVDHDNVAQRMTVETEILLLDEA